MKQASKLVWLRHKPVVILTVLLAVVFLAFDVKSSYDSYQYTKRDALSAAKFDRQYKDWGYKRNQFSKYERDTFTMIQRDDDTDSPLPELQTGSSVATVTILLLTVLGLFIACWDGQSQFNRYLFGVGMPRKSGYWAKMRLYLPLVAVISLVEALVPILAAKAYIAPRFYDLTLRQTALIGWYNLLLALTGFLVAFFVGTVFTRPVVATLGTVVLIWWTNSAYVNIGYLTHAQDTDAVWSGGFDQPGGLFWWGVGFAAVVVVVTLALGAWSYNHLSLETEGEQLYLPQLRWLIVGVAAVVAFFTFMSQNGPHTFEWGLSITAAVITLILGGVWQGWPQIRRRYRKLRHFAD